MSKSLWIWTGTLAVFLWSCGGGGTSTGHHHDEGRIYISNEIKREGAPDYKPDIRVKFQEPETGITYEFTVKHGEQKELNKDGTPLGPLPGGTEVKIWITVIRLNEPTTEIKVKVDGSLIVHITGETATYVPSKVIYNLEYLN
ncbi:MAG TPA: hypothetical protein EYP61_10035 [Candidatus Latescibacteria bacterium]|nr:hypothetical protein [Candidatus Latescibacterota bacterium]